MSPLTNNDFARLRKVMTHNSHRKTKIEQQTLILLTEYIHHASTSTIGTLVTYSIPTFLHGEAELLRHVCMTLLLPHSYVLDP
jgi:hypothetical protein